MKNKLLENYLSLADIKEKIDEKGNSKTNLELCNIIFHNSASGEWFYVNK